MLKSIYDIHIMGIIHRDIKAMNAGLIEDLDGTVKVLLYDFGNARLFTDDEGNVGLFLFEYILYIIRYSLLERPPTSAGHANSQAAGPTTCETRRVGTTSSRGSTRPST